MANLSFEDYCKQTNRTYLLDQWDTEKNEGLTPADITYGSNDMIWWKCEQGHSWSARLKSRAQGCGCPICAKRYVVSGVNDLATTNPELAAEWHPTKNGLSRAEDFIAGTKTKVWWRCPQGHEWYATINSRTSSRSGCPVCSGRLVISGVNDLMTKFPDIAAEWHPTKNAPLTPDKVSPYSNARVWWVCPEGHVYHTSVSSRSWKKSRCPYCTGRKVLPGFNDLETKEPAIAAQWHPTLNGAVTPSMVTVGSHKMAWWQCPLGHVWRTVVCSRTGNDRTGCPACAGKLNSPTLASPEFVEREERRMREEVGTKDDW